MNKFVKTNIPTKNIIKEYLQSINGLLKATDKELELLTMLIEMDINYVYIDEMETKNVANTANRKILMKLTGMTRDNLSTYITRLVRKGLLIKGRPDELHVRPELIPTIAGDTVQVLLVLKTDKNETRSRDIQ